MIQKVSVPVSGKPFNNNTTYCVGTGRMGLALQKEYLDHLKMVQETIRFRYIRGHGLFCDDVGGSHANPMQTPCRHGAILANHAA